MTEHQWISGVPGCGYLFIQQLSFWISGLECYQVLSLKFDRKWCSLKNIQNHFFYSRKSGEWMNESTCLGGCNLDSKAIWNVFRIFKPKCKVQSPLHTHSFQWIYLSPFLRWQIVAFWEMGCCSATAAQKSMMFLSSALFFDESSSSSHTLPPPPPISEVQSLESVIGRDAEGWEDRRVNSFD